MQSNEVRLALFDHDALEYRFCSPGWRAERRPVAVRERLEALGLNGALHGVHRLLIEGGGLFEHPEVPAALHAAGSLGVASLAVQTDAGSLAQPGRAQLLAAAGVDTLFLVVGGIRKRVYETVMRDPDGLREAMEGIRQAAEHSATMRTYLIVPLLRWTEDDVVPLLEWTEHVPGRVQGFLLALPEARRVPQGFRSALLPPAEQAALAEKVFDACSRRSVEYGFSSHRGISPCATAGALERFGTVFHERFNYLKHASAKERFVRVAACASCSLEASCRGLEEDDVKYFGSDELRPVPLEHSMSWKLRRLNRLEERDYKYVSEFENEFESSARSLVRINGHCNMACAFCFVDRTVPDFEYDSLAQQIDRLAARQTNHLVLSGGEPTLHPRLTDLVRHARGLGFRTIEMQSNGVRAADMGYARALADAGMNKVTVSLHSADPEQSDEITRLPKAFGKTMRAMHNFRSMGVLTQVAHVITEANYRQLPDTVRFLRTEFPADGGHLSICFGIAQGISDLVFQWVIPRFREIRPYMRDALDYCIETGIGFGGMLGQGGYPPCMLDGEMKYYDRVLGHVYRSADHDDQFYKAPRCRECSFDSHCVGVRRSYVEAYGEDEIAPFQREISARVESETSPREADVLVPLRMRRSEP